MKRAELLDAILKDKKQKEAAPYSEDGEAKMDGLSEMTKKELYDIAAGLDISGRSKMKRDELLGAIENEEPEEA